MKFEVRNRWNGEPCPKDIWADFIVMEDEKGVHIHVTLPEDGFIRVPDAPAYTRIDGLWEYDVAELFFVLDNGRYIEFEIDREGHYLLLEFDEPRKRSNDHVHTALEIDTSTIGGEIHHKITLPKDIFTSKIVKANTFVIAGGEFLAWNPVPGDQPDFHQPGTFPKINTKKPQ